MAGLRLQHASVPMPADGHEKGRHFYGETLGLTEVTPPEVLGNRVVWFVIGEQKDEIHLYTDEKNANPNQHLCIQVEDQQAVRDRLDANGYRTEDTDAIPNRPRFFTQDPFGNRVEITSILGQYS